MKKNSIRFFSVILTVMAVICLLWISAYARMASTKGSSQPGNVNPSTPGSDSLFRDDELLMMVGDPAANQVNFIGMYPNNANLSAWTSESKVHTYQSSEYDLVNGKAPVWASARGVVLYTPSTPAKDQVAYAFYRPDGDVELELWNYPNRQASYTKLSGTTGAQQSVDVAVGDLDQLVDNMDYFHDEIAVARIIDGDTVRVDVLDYNFNVLTGAEIPAASAPQGVAVSIGDFDGDGILDLAVAQAAGEGNNLLQIDLYHALLDANGKVITPLQLVHATTTIHQSHGGAQIDMTAGDFVGQRSAGIAIVQSDGDPTHHFYMILFDADANFNLHYYIEDQPWDIGCNPQIKTGLFYFNPDDNNHGLGRRQLAVASLRVLSSGEQQIGVWTIDVIPEGSKSKIYYWDPNCNGEGVINFSSPDTSNLSNLSLDTGNFIGHQASGCPPPTEQIAIGCTAELNNGNDKPHLSVIGYNNSNQWHEPFTYYYSWDGNEQARPAPVMVTANDIDGDTYRLGTPAHFTLNNLISMDYLLQEPPKHLDYLPEDPTNPNGDWLLYNVSAFGEFVIELEDENSQTIESSTERNSSMTTGQSSSDDVGGSISLGYGDIASVKLSADKQSKTSTDYSSSQSYLNSNYSSTSVEYSTETNIDDNLRATIQSIDVWRYPVYSLTTDDGQCGVMEIVIPGADTVIDTGGGKDHPDWYQPYHQNRNALSYPHFIADYNNYTPTDLGSFTLPNGTKVTDTMNTVETYFWDGDSHTYSLSWSDEAGNEQAKSYDHTLSKSEELTVGVSASVEFYNNGVEAEKSVSTGFDTTSSWGGDTTASAENSNSEGVTLLVPDKGGEEWGYAYQTPIYISSQGGFFRVAQATDPLGGQGGNWWRSQYGPKPDPALNLPNRFLHHAADSTHVGEWWTLNTDNDRKEMRGFTLRYSTPDPITGNYEYIGQALSDGDVVRLSARVYNYSLFTPVNQVQVSFYGIVYDPVSGSEVGDRFHIGDATASFVSIASLQSDGSYIYNDQSQWMQEVSINWDTTGRSDTGGYNTYRIYVIVDEDNQVPNEIHEWKDTLTGALIPSGNNEGYWPWQNAIAVLPANNGDSKNKAGKKLSDIDVSMNVSSLGVTEGKGQPMHTSDGTVLTVGQKYMLRVRIMSDGDNPPFRYALFSIGDRIALGKVFSTHRVFGLSDGDNYCWAEWTPTETGEYIIWAKVIEDSNEVNPGNAKDSLRVYVQDPSSSGGGSHHSGGCFVASVLGPKMLAEIQTLRNFRDRCMLTNPVGKFLAKLYYRNSPPAADYIRRHPLMKQIAGAILKPVVWVCGKMVKLQASLNERAMTEKLVSKK